jgi:glycosyltransferase involved in cell wall biosynthesis
MPREHVLLYSDDASAGGVAQYNHSVLMALAVAGYRVTRSVSETKDPMTEAQVAAGITQRWIPRYPDVLTPAANHAEMRAYFQEMRPDLVIFSDSCPVVNLAAKQVAAEMGIPYIIVEGFVAPYLAERFGQIIAHLERVFRQARAVVAVSQENLDLMHRLFRLPAAMGNVIHYGRPPAYFAPRDEAGRAKLRGELGIPQDAVVAVTTARLEDVKGYDVQVHAIAQLRKMPAWEKLYFVWVGAGAMEKDLRSAIEQLGVADRVKMVGLRWDVPAFLNMADMYVLPTRFEGMPLAIMEAMAKGLPVIASAVSGIPEELGTAGKLLRDPTVNPHDTIADLIAVVAHWASDDQERLRMGEASRQRAEAMFREDLMVARTLRIVDGALLPKTDYVTPGFAVVRPDTAFPNMAVADASKHPWEHFRREIPHTYYCDKRYPPIGFASRDEASILHNTALQFAAAAGGKPVDVLEIGCWMGWSAAHLALAGEAIRLDVVDPLLEKPDHRADVEASLKAAGVLERVNLVGGFSPAKVHELAAARNGRKWSLIFIDGEHGRPGPLNDATACIKYAAEDCAILFHDLASPEVMEGLDYLKKQGWRTRIYMTKQIMGVAWRGNVRPLAHVPDPRIQWPIPAHLAGHEISGMANAPAQSPQPQRTPTMVTVQGPIISFGNSAR